MNPTTLPAWQRLHELTRLHSDKPADPSDQPGSHEKNFVPLNLQLGSLHVDFSRQRLTQELIDNLVALAEQANLGTAINNQLRGATINTSEGRAALHSALRAPLEARPSEVDETIEEELERLFAFVTKVRTRLWRGYTGKAIRTLVHIGIGGSHFGPELVYSALSSPTDPFEVRFLANLDAQAADSVLRDLDPATTLFIVASKSFGTLETKLNAQLARSWFLERTNSIEAIAQHFVAVTSNHAAAAEFGIPSDNLFAIWDWVGGRYSVWSAVGLPIMLALGEAEFMEMLAGAFEVDQHFATAPFAQNLPVLMAMIGIWNYNFCGVKSLAVLSYDRRLRLLPDYLQQLEMESNGKSVDRDGNPVTYPTMPVLWGGEETNGQHAFHQLLHQGTQIFTADFIGTITPAHRHLDQHNWQLANMLAQAEAMEFGDAQEDTQRAVAGGHTTTTVLFESLTPRSLGTLLALYEQKVFCQGVIWNLNSFDQWGVELGKRLADGIYPALAQGTRLANHQATSQRLVDRIDSLRNKTVSAGDSA